jgi:predicted peptidase
MLGTLVASLAIGSPQTPLGQQEAAFSRRITKTVQGRYLISLPEDYASQPRKRYPLILFLHGSGERGEDLSLVAKHGPPKEIAAGRKLPFIVVSPQCPAGEWWSTEVLTALLDEVERKYRVDRKREYLTGLSMGGFGTWNLAAATPKRFAAIAPICGGGDPKQAHLLKDIPIWGTHGDADQAVPLATGLAMVDAVRAAGGNPRYDVIKGGGHDVWTDVYAGTALYDWFLTHKK